jgi:hypothetical protein
MPLAILINISIVFPLAVPGPLSAVAAIIVAGPMPGKGSLSSIRPTTFEYYIVMVIIC